MTTEPETEKAAKSVNHIVEYEQWRTVAVYALPGGWRNIYKERDGSFSVHESPAMLIRETNTYTPSMVLIHSDKQKMESPPERRVVFGHNCDGEVEEAQIFANYSGTISPTTDLEEHLKSL